MSEARNERNELADPPGSACLFVVSCSQRKTAALKTGPTPARDAYDGTAFKIARRLIENAGLKWCILSGYYGFLWPDTVIEYYDVKMDPDPDRPWGGEFDSIKQKQYGRLMSARNVVLLGSRLYARTAEIMLCRSVVAPLAGLPIGKALRKLKEGEWLNLHNSPVLPPSGRSQREFKGGVA
jgi:hypothetical protein